jgi:hypothetical protein
LTSPESNECPSSDVTVCIGGYKPVSLFVHVTLSPTWIETEAGLNAMFLIETDFVAASADVPNSAVSDIDKPRTSLGFSQLRDRLAVITRRYGPTS